MWRLIPLLLTISLVSLMLFVPDVAFADVPSPGANCDNCTVFGERASSGGTKGLAILVLVLVSVIVKLRRRS